VQIDYFSIFQLLPALLWVVIILVVAQVRKGNFQGDEGRYYMYNVYAKLFFSLAFVLFFILAYGGGDTIAYYHGTTALNNLFMEDPALYFEQMITTPSESTKSIFFNSRTGFPPGWIYREAEGFFVCKITSVFSFFTFKSFIATTLLLSYFVASATWKLFLYVRRMNIVNERYLAIGLLFLPSVNFWCSGISKDTFVYIGVVLMVYNGFKIISKDTTHRIRAYLMFALMALMVYHIRSVVLYVTILSLALAYSTSIAKRISNSNQAIIFIRFTIVIGGFIVLTQALTTGSEDEFLEQNEIFQQAAITQRDFATNVTYGENRYSIGEIEYTPIGLIRAAPFAMIAGIFRPFIWEALSPSLIFNGFESILFLYLLFVFFRKDARLKFRLIQTNELLLFSLSFVLILAFVTGLTSGLFGVLVRLRAPLLPFAIILMSIVITTKETHEKDEVVQTKLSE
jgi:hypothetical protein